MASAAIRLVDLIAEVTSDETALIGAARIAGFIGATLNATPAESEAIQDALYAWARSVRTGWFEQ